MGIKVIWWKPPLPEPAMLSGAVYPQAYCDSVFQSRSAKFSLKPYLQEVGSVYPLACPAGSALSSYIWTIIPFVIFLMLGCYLLSWRRLYHDTVPQHKQISLKALCV